jgi:hypothetical protein
MKKYSIRSLKICGDCGKKMRRFRTNKGKFVCYPCSIKDKKIINPHKYFNMEKALSKEYIVHGYGKKKSCSIVAVIHVPSVLIGHKVRLIVTK